MRAFGQHAPVAAVSNAPYMAWFSRFSKNRKCCLMMETSHPFLKTRPTPAGRRTGPMRRERCHATRPESVQPESPTARERPVHTFTTSLLPVRGAGEGTSQHQKRTHVTALMGLELSANGSSRRGAARG